MSSSVRKIVSGRIAAGAALAFALVAFTPTAQAMTPTVLLSGASNAADPPAVGIDASGHAIAAWCWNGQAQFSLTHGYQGWGGVNAAPKPLSTILTSPANVVTAVAPNGDTVVAWSDKNDTEVRAFVRAGAHESPTWIATPTRDGVEHLSAAISSSGRAVVVWQVDSATSRVQAFFPHLWAFRRVGRPPVYTIVPQTVSSADAAFAPSVGIDRAGNAIMIWAGDSSPNSSLQYALAPAGKPFGSPRTAGYLNQASASGTSPALAVSPGGAVVAAWNDATITADFGTATGGLGSPVDLGAQSGVIPGQPVAAVDDNGDAVVGWSGDDSGSGAFGAQFFHGGTSVGGFQELKGLDVNDKDELALAMGATGEAWLAYVGDAPNGNTQVDLVHGSASTPFAAALVTTLSPPSTNAQYPALALNAKNQFVAAWIAHENNDQVQAVGSKIALT